jgi:hypothetical protein
MWQRLDLLNIEYSKICFPSMILEQWIVIGADPFWPALPGSSSIEHAAEYRTINITRLDCESNNPTGELIHDEHYPVALQQPGRRTRLDDYRRPGQSPWVQEER